MGMQLNDCYLQFGPRVVTRSLIIIDSFIYSITLLGVIVIKEILIFCFIFL